MISVVSFVLNSSIFHGDREGYEVCSDVKKIITIASEPQLTGHHSPLLSEAPLFNINSISSPVLAMAFQIVHILNALQTVLKNLWSVYKATTAPTNGVLFRARCRITSCWYLEAVTDGVAVYRANRRRCSRPSSQSEIITCLANVTSCRNSTVSRIPSL